MASTSNFVSVTLTENDVPGAKLDTQDFGKYSNTQLKRWLQCRGLRVSGNRSNLLARPDTMEAEGLHLNIDYVGSSGIILSPEQKAALQTSLVILQNENRFNRVYFWGKILGTKDDYFIAQGVGKNEFAGRKTFYSKDCINWGLLPPATKSMKIQSKLAKGRFLGDPSNEYEHVEIKKVGDGEDAIEEEETITIKEEDRLASVISEIDEDVRVVPRGAFIKTPTGDVVVNRGFEGLNIPEAAKLCNYFHFREPITMNEKTLLQKANLDKAIDFMDSVDEDIPREMPDYQKKHGVHLLHTDSGIMINIFQGSWSLMFERGSGLVTLRSLLWQGYTFYHVPGSRKYGSVYFGNGEKNLDLPFML